jgi:hypothetical protein
MWAGMPVAAGFAILASGMQGIHRRKNGMRGCTLTRPGGFGAVSRRRLPMSFPASGATRLRKTLRIHPGGASGWLVRKPRHAGVAALVVQAGQHGRSLL